MFSLDSLFGQKMTKLFDLCLLNILCIITCIPVITIGPSLIALYSVLFAMSRDEEGPVLKMYFRKFKENLKTGMHAGIIYTIMLTVLLFDIRIWEVSQSEAKPMFVTATIILIVFVIMLGCWIFPLMAKFENSVKNMYKNAAIFAFKYFPVSISMGIVLMGYTMLVMEHIFTAGILFFFFGIVILAYPWTFYVRTKFEKYLEERGEGRRPAAEDSGSFLAEQEDEAH